MISKSLKSDGRIGLDMEVISTPRLLEAALILGSAGLPFINHENNYVAIFHPFSTIKATDF
jgi:hypothetical protein